MKTNFSRDANGGLTLIEALVVVACVVILMAMLLPGLSGSHKSQAGICMGRVREVEIGFLMYAGDNHGKFAIQTSITNNGTMEFLERNQTFPHYQKLLKYLPQMSSFICPADKNRQPAANFDSLTDSNLSYFLNADISSNNPRSIMMGDRCLQANGEPVGHGTFIAQTNMHFTWTSEMHRGFGILGFADGHAELCRPTNLNAAFQRQGMATVRLAVP